MQPPEAVYNKAFCEKNEAKAWRYIEIPKAAKIIYDHFLPTSVVDVGCGNGLYLKAFSSFGCPSVFGIEGTQEWSTYIAKNFGPSFSIHDVRKPFTIHRKFDLAISIEMLEHLEEPYADTAANNISSLSDTLCITASRYPSKLHPNPQLKSYWIPKFEANNFVFQEDETNYLQNIFKARNSKFMTWYTEDLMIFRR